MVPLIALICVLKPVQYVREKKFSIEKHKIFLFQVFDLWFFTKIFILQQCLNPNPYPNPNFFFGLGSSQNIRIISIRIRIHNTAIRCRNLRAIEWYRYQKHMCKSRETIPLRSCIIQMRLLLRKGKMMRLREKIIKLHFGTKKLPMRLQLCLLSLSLRYTEQIKKIRQHFHRNFTTLTYLFIKNQIEILSWILL
jgi:hypothetical protein